MDKVLKSLSDVERKLAKISAISEKGAANFKIKDVVKLSRKGNSITATMKKCHKDLQATAPTEAESKEMLIQMTRINELNQKQMKFIVESKPTFDKIKVSGIVRKNMEKNQGDARAFAQTLVEKAPENLKPEFVVLNEQIEKTVKHTMEVYDGATGGEDQIDDKIDDSD